MRVGPLCHAREGQLSMFDPAPDVVQTDTIPTVKPRRNRKSAKDAGTRFETSIVNWLQTRLGDDRIERRTKRGAKDRGDIGGLRTIRGARVVAELKNTARVDLPGWLREAHVEAANDDAAIGVVIHKKRGTTDPSEQYVCMDMETFARLLEGGPDELRGT